MNKELIKELKKLNELLGEVLDENIEELTKELNKELKRGLKEKAKLSVETFGNGNAKTCIEGKTLPILIALSTLEKTVLKDLNPPKGLYELIKNKVQSMEDNNE